MPTILDLLNAIIFRKDGTKKQKKFDKRIGIISSSILRGIISILVLPFKAYMSLNAIIKTIYRMKISKKHLLEWTTAEEAENTSKTDLLSYIKYMSVQIIFALAILLLTKNIILSIISIIWIIAPYFMWYISKENKEEVKNISKQNKEYILELGKETWNYFKTYINEENNYLPPDNYQEDRAQKIVYRTSSTNIGLGLLSVASACDLQYIKLEDAINLLEKMIETIEKLQKWNGHLYNWYNTKTLMPLIPRYISTVDSGNFVGYLYTLQGFLQEKLNQYKDQNKVQNLIEIADKLIHNTDFSFLYDKEKSIFSIGYNIEDGKLTNSYYDLLASEARQASLIAIAKRDIPAKHWSNLSRTLTVLDKYKGLVSWSGTAFEYLMPNINIPKYSGSLLDESCKFMLYSQKKYSKKLGIPWGISESAFNLKDLNLNYQYKAFGIPWLGLKRGLADEMVVSSYGSVLAITEAPNEVIENLKILDKEGMRGEFGLYEAIDYTPNRVPFNKKSVPVKTYMAHHQALILLSINNFINSNILQKRFMSNPELKTIDILLQENMPENVIITKERKEKIDKIKYVGYNSYIENVYTKINEKINNYNLISNGDYCVIMDEKGNGYSKYKNIQINRFKETQDFEQGIYFYIKNIRTKKVWKSTFLNKEDKFRVHFTVDKDKFVRIDENIETVTEIIVAPNENVEIRRIELTNKGNVEEILEITSVLEPILSNKEQDYAHPTFNNLFLKYNILEDNTILITRNKRGKVEPIHFGVNLFPNCETIGDLEYEIDKDKLYENGDTIIPKAIKDSKPFSKNLGLVTEPIIALKRTIKVKPGETATLNLIMSVAENEEEVKNNLTVYENNEKVERCFEVSRARVEEEARYLGITGSNIENFKKIFSYLQFQNPTKKLYINKLPKISYKQSDLWKYGISGDLPILLVKIKDINDINVVKEVLKAYEFFKVKNIQIDLVILDEEENIYERYVQEAIINEILSMQLSYMQNISGGIFLLNTNEIEDVNLLLFRANLLIEANKGNLNTILNEIEEDYLETIKNIGNDNIQYEAVKTSENNNYKLEIENLKYYNEYGAFSQDGKEYIIKINNETTPPTVWSHIIANENFGTLVTSNMGGFTWSKNSRLNRLTTWSNDSIFDTPSEIIYLKDVDTGEISSLGSKPIKQSGDYYVIYGFGYAKYIHSSLGIIQEDEIFVPREDSVKINIITLKNTMPNKKKLKLYYYIKPVLGEDEIKTNGYIDTKFNKNSNIIYSKNLYGEDFSKIFYVSSSEKIFSYTGSKKEFIGKGTLSNPDGLKKVRLAEENTLGIDNCIAIQIDVELESYENKEISLIIGEEDTILEAQNKAYKYCKLNNCKEELNNIKNYWKENLSKLQVNTPVESINILLNGWLVYQTIVSRLWARSAFYQSGGALGFRDQLQDTLGLKYIYPEIMRNQIIKHSKHQFKEGDVEHWWHDETGKGIRSKISDDLLWLVYVVSEYIELTGNYDILDEETPFLSGEELKLGEDERYDLFNEGEEKASIYNHCIRAIEKTLNFGKNNLPKIGTGDWNDGFSNVGEKGIGESVWLGFFLYIILERFIPICKKKNDIERVEKYKKVQENLKKTLNTVGWDGRWYRRAFTDNGDILGSIVNEECKIDSIAQSWSVISNAGDNDKKYICMESLENHLVDKENGIIKLLDPPFEKSKLEPGYIKAYLPGVRENGGQYTHAAVWTIIAECKLGFGDKAYEFFKMINPIEHSKTLEQANKYKVEPYVIAADIYGTQNLKGRGGWTWYTGSSSWYYKAGIEYILGLKIENKYLKVEPCIPKEWKEYSMQYKYGTSTYNIKVKNPNLKNTGVEKFIVNGEEIKEKKILLQDNSKIYNIEICM